MTKKMIFPLLLGASGLAILLWLGFWQVQRMEWKTRILNEIDAKINAPAQSIPEKLNKEEHNRISVQGEFLLQEGEIHVLTSDKFKGPGFRLIKPAVEIRQARKVLIDFGYFPEADKNAEREEIRVRVLGNLLWPDEVDNYTPEPNMERNIWFARDINKMADSLNAEPILIVARDYMGDPLGVSPVAIGVNIPNDHREYAITWFSLALVWSFMTGYWLMRLRKNKL